MSTRRRATEEEVATLRRELADRDLFIKLRDVAKQYGVTLEAVLSGERTLRVVMGRDACIMKLLGFHMSTTEVGRLMGMNHSSIVVARQRYTKRDNGKLLT